jgi:hypothetical protein
MEHPGSGWRPSTGAHPLARSPKREIKSPSARKKTWAACTSPGMVPKRTVYIRRSLSEAERPYIGISFVGLTRCLRRSARSGHLASDR